MLKRTLFITLCLVMVFSLSAFAGEGSDTVGGGKLLPQLRYGYSVSKWDTHSDDVLMKHWDVKAHTYYAQVNWGILDNVDIIALVGGRSAKSEADTVVTFFIPLNFAEETDYVPMLMWGVGVKGTFYRADNGFYVGGGALFTNAISDDYSIKLSLNGAELFESGDIYHRNVYKLTPEIHAGWRFNNGLTPYVGADYSWTRSIMESDAGLNVEYRMRNPFAMFAGIDYLLMDRLYVNVEGRTNFIDGWGIETGLGYKFDLCAKPAPAPAPAPAPVIEPKIEPMSKN
jgi:hypothetical protein